MKDHGSRTLRRTDHSRYEMMDRGDIVEHLLIATAAAASRGPRCEEDERLQKQNQQLRQELEDAQGQQADDDGSLDLRRHQGKLWFVCVACACVIDSLFVCTFMCNDAFFHSEQRSPVDYKTKCS